MDGATCSSASTRTLASTTLSIACSPTRWRRSSRAGRGCKQLSVASCQTEGMASHPCLCPRQSFASELQYVARQVLVLHDVGEGLAHVVGVDGHALLFHVRGLEADLIQHALHDGMQAACADV